MIVVALIGLFLGGIIGTRAPQPVKATSSDPKLAVRQEKIVHGVLWGLCYKEGLERAKRSRKPILIYFSGINDANSRTMEFNVFRRPEIVALLSRFETIDLSTDDVPIHSLTRDERETIGQKNLELEAALAGVTTSPFFVAIRPNGEVLRTFGYRPRPDAFSDYLHAALTAHRRRTSADAQGHGR
jgi:hypothetical protein